MKKNEVAVDVKQLVNIQNTTIRQKKKIEQLEKEIKELKEQIACISDDKRVCFECGDLMEYGYCVYGGLEYYCSDKCLHKHYTDEEWQQMYDNNDDCYYTDWSDEIERN